MNLEHRKEMAITLTQHVAQYIREQFKKVSGGELKKDGSLVSEVDMYAEELIISGLSKAFPDDSFCSEERKDTNGDTEFEWIIDPLDGTTNFLAGLPLFGTLVALSHKKNVILGVCAFPLLEEFFVAEKGMGATLNGTAIHVAKSSGLQGEIFFPDGNMRKAKQSAMRDIDLLTQHQCRIRILGSSPLSATRVAMGVGVVATFRVTKPWDIAAPCILVEEAGGKVTDMQGNPWKLDSKELVITNGIVHEHVLAVLNS